jgi:hypothetical protein
MVVSLAEDDEPSATVNVAFIPEASCPAVSQTIATAPASMPETKRCAVSPALRNGVLLSRALIAKLCSSVPAFVMSKSTSPGGIVAGDIVIANSVIRTCTVVVEPAADELDDDEPPLLLLIATTATTPNTSAAIETATNMRPTTDLARNDSFF